MKVCKKCFKVLHPRDVFHHKQTCDGETPDIDEQLCDVISKLWEKGITTRYCCVGHFEKNVFSPYIVFTAPIYEQLLQVKDSSKEFITYDISCSDNQSHITYVYANLGIDIEKLDIADKLHIQYNFLLFLYAVLNTCTIDYTVPA